MKQSIIYILYLNSFVFMQYLNYLNSNFIFFLNLINIKFQKKKIIITFNYYKIDLNSYSASLSYSS